MRRKRQRKNVRDDMEIVKCPNGSRTVHHPSGVTQTETLADRRERRRELVAGLDAARQALADFEIANPEVAHRE